MAKKKINPEDLQLNEELVNGRVSLNSSQTRNTCYPDKPLPEACDTTTTDPTFNGCTTLEEDKCDQSLIECPSKPCDSLMCNDTRSAGIICCDTIKNCKETNICQVYPSVDVCLETENTCEQTGNDCRVTYDCVAYTANCVDTDMCEYPPISMEIDCQVPAD